jgi:hypothetical protein
MVVCVKIKELDIFFNQRIKEFINALCEEKNHGRRN